MGYNTSETYLSGNREASSMYGSDFQARTSRRHFMEKVAKKAIQIIALAATTNALQGSDKFVREALINASFEQPDNKSETNASAFQVIKANTYFKQPALFNGKVFDIKSRTYADSPSSDAILLSSTDVFLNRAYLSSRNMLPTPELLLKHPTFLEIMARSDELYRAMHKRLGGQFQEFHFPQALSTAIIETLLYDSKRAQKRPFSSLYSQLSDKATDCQEFSAITAYALACNGISSDLLGFSFWSPGDEKSLGNKKSHVCNVLNIDNTCCVIDTTFSNRIYTLADYFRLKSASSEIINNQIFIDSVFPYQTMPWGNPLWIGKANALIAQGSNYVASIIDSMRNVQTA